MSKALVATPQHVGSTIVPEDGVDQRTALSIEPAFQRLTDSNELQQQVIAGLVVDNVSARRITFPAVEDEQADEWQMSGVYTSGTRYIAQGTPNASHPGLYLALPGLPAGWRINTVRGYFEGTTQRVIGTNPNISLMYKTAGSPPVNHAIASLNTNDAAYPTEHSVDIAAGNFVIPEETWFYMRINGEFGSGAASGLKFFGVRVTLLVPTTFVASATVPP